MACSRTGLDVPSALDAAAETGLPSPPDCLDDDLPSATSPESVPLGLHVLDAAPCEAWSDPPKRATWSTPSSGPPQELWRTNGDPHVWSHVVVSIDGSIWVTEYHPASTWSDYFTIANYDRRGSLQWRSRPLCNALPALSVGPDAIGIVGANTNWRTAQTAGWRVSQTIYFRLAPDGHMLNAWASPDGLSEGFAVRSGSVLFAGRPEGVLASCRGERPMWTRTMAQHATTNCSPLVFWTRPEPDGTTWVDLYTVGNPTRLAPDGSVLETLPRSTPPSSGFPWAGVVGTQDPDVVLVGEGTFDGDCYPWPTQRAFSWQSGQVMNSVEVSLASPADLTSPGFLLAPDRSTWSVSQFNWVERFVSGQQVWKRSDLAPAGSFSASRWAADGSLLEVFGSGTASPFIARIARDGSVAWRIDLQGSYGQAFEVAPDGVVYAIVNEQLVAIQTDFVPARRAGEIELPNGFNE